MADIVIRGMEMPRGCFECPFDRFGDVRDRVTSCCLKTEQGEKCPLVELPEGHGRLIDADALQAKFEMMENAFAEHGRPYSFAFKDGGEMCAEWWTVQDALAREPTIVPAEGGNADG